jgi:hypothetical protein
MKIKVDYAKLHSALFLGGKNHGEKLFNKAGMTLSYDTATKELIATYNGKTHHLVSFEGYEPATHAKEELEPAYAPPGKVKAQVSTPQDHVFSSGPGKTHN